MLTSTTSSGANHDIESAIVKAKVCHSCHTEKPLSEFYIRLASPDGHQRSCKQCQQSRQAKARNQDWVARLIMYAGFSTSGKRAKRKKWDRPNLTKEFLLELYKKQNGRCYWTRVSLNLARAGSLTDVSLDRLDGDLGYLQGNVVLTCRGANLARNDSTPEEMLQFIRLIRRTP